MRTQEYVIRQVDGLWHVRRDGRLVSGQPSQMDALHIAEALSYRDGVGGEGLSRAG